MLDLAELLRAARTRARALRYARSIELAANYIIGIALLPSLEACAATGRRLRVGRRREERRQAYQECRYRQHSITQ